VVASVARAAGVNLRLPANNLFFHRTRLSFTFKANRGTGCCSVRFSCMPNEPNDPKPPERKEPPVKDPQPYKDPIPGPDTDVPTGDPMPPGKDLPQM
jgi:hypothetical protein